MATTTWRRTGRRIRVSGLTADLVLGVSRSLSGRRWLWRPAEDRVAAGIAQKLVVPEIVSVEVLLLR